MESARFSFTLGDVRAPKLRALSRIQTMQRARHHSRRRRHRHRRVTIDGLNAKYESSRQTPTTALTTAALGRTASEAADDSDDHDGDGDGDSCAGRARGSRLTMRRRRRQRRRLSTLSLVVHAPPKAIKRLPLARARTAAKVTKFGARRAIAIVTHHGRANKFLRTRSIARQSADLMTKKFSLFTIVRFMALSQYQEIKRAA